jgi:hypothetical protein
LSFPLPEAHPESASPRMDTAASVLFCTSVSLY